MCVHGFETTVKSVYKICAKKVKFSGKPVKSLKFKVVKVAIVQISIRGWTKGLQGL